MSAAKRALITGIAGQDGSYLAELLLEHGYEVHGLVRRPLDERFDNIEHIRAEIELLVGDIRDRDVVESAIERIRPDELYHLASPSFVPDLWDRPADALEAIAGATALVLQTVRLRSPQTRVLIASSRELFGDAPESPQRETTPYLPTNPYGIAKLSGHLLCGTLREHDGMHACSAIFYNHDSPRRPERFVTRKVTRAAAAIKLGLEHELVLGDLDAVRDWCSAGDAVRAAWMALTHETAGDYVIASGTGRTIHELVRCAFDYVGIDPEGHLRVDRSFVRPRERFPPVGDPSRIRETLGWEARMSFEDLIAEMVEADLRRLRDAA